MKKIIKVLVSWFEHKNQVIIHFKEIINWIHQLNNKLKSDISESHNIWPIQAGKIVGHKMNQSLS